MANLIAAALGLAWSVGWPGPVTLAAVDHRGAGRVVVAVACLVPPFIVPPGAGEVAALALPAALGRGHDHRPPGPGVSGPAAAAGAGQGHLYPLHRPGADRLVSGQSAADFAPRADNLAHGFGAVLCRVRSARPGWLVLEFVRRDALAAIIPALPIPAAVDLRALAVGRREDGSRGWCGCTARTCCSRAPPGPGRPRSSGAWSVPCFPALRAGLVRLLGADPKLMELAYGRDIFDRYGRYAADPADIVAMLEEAVADMQDRAETLGGKQREHTPTAEFPFVVIIVDEVAFLTAYQPDKALRERVKAALATLTTQGRAVGYCVVAALQDPRKEVMSIRNLFPDRIAMRLDEPEQVDMVLGDGARDRGAAADLISTDPAIGAGVAFVRLDSDPDPVRVRAAWVTDADIRAMADLIRPACPDRGGGGGMTAPPPGGPMTRARSAAPACTPPTTAPPRSRRTARCAAGRPPGRPGWTVRPHD